VAKSFKTSISIDDAASAASEALRTKVAGDSAARLSIDAGGKLTWGAGSGSGDVTLYRSAANTLKTDDALQAAAGLITSTTSGAPSATIADGAIAIDTTNDAFYYRSSSTWQQVSSGASISVSDTAPSSPDAGDMWYESDTGNTLVYYQDANTSQWVEVGHAADSTVVEYAVNVDGGTPSSNYTGISSFDGGGV
jgi:hypothetical protein|tara:strand:+ start:2908 stop:3489 length:582 start_codon:yes stop_codon:yes gene_type:complete